MGLNESSLNHIIHENAEGRHHAQTKKGGESISVLHWLNFAARMVFFFFTLFGLKTNFHICRGSDHCAEGIREV